MRVGVVGAGYVGLVTAACLAETGHDVVCADVDQAKVDRLRQGDVPIYEPGLEPLVVANQAAGRLRFTTDVPEAIRYGKVVMIAVGTPHEQGTGSADLSQVLAVARAIGQHLTEPKVVVTKSTVPVGTSERVRAEIQGVTSQPFHMCSNPEFLKQGAGVEDFMRPDRVVLGVDHPEAREVMEELYAAYLRNGNPILVMDIPSAELTKYAANAMLASRISFMNQVAELCDQVGADVDLVRRGIASDKRIGPAFLFAGPGYGGSCFPKDVKALVDTATRAGLPAGLFGAIEAVNERQKQVMLRKVEAALEGGLAGCRVALWGLAFKAGTDDMRDSPAIPLVEGLLAGGASVVAHDPRAGPRARLLFGDRIQYATDHVEMTRGADGLVIATEWPVYRNPDFARLRELMRRPVIVDGRNLYDPARMRQQGFRYTGIGRGSA